MTSNPLPGRRCVAAGNPSFAAWPVRQGFGQPPPGTLARQDELDTGWRTIVTTPTTPTTFRSHDQYPPSTNHRTVPLFGTLLEEWVRLNSSRVAASTVQRWAADHPVLAGANRPADIVDAVDAAPTERQDAILLALLRLTQAGEQLAGRILVQQMLPRLASLRWTIKTPIATSADYRHCQDRVHIIVATFWEIVATYPVERRPTRVAANLALDTLGHVCRIADRSPDLLPHEPIDEGELLNRHAPQHPQLAAEQAEEMPAILRWATDTGVLTTQAAHLLNDIYAQGEAPLDYSRRTGISHASVKQQCLRAKRRLRAALDHKGRPSAPADQVA